MTTPAPGGVTGGRNPALGPLAGLLGTRPMAIPNEPRGPLYTWLAGNGLLADRTLPPEFNVVVAPGYEHLDVLTAAPVQNSGRPEIVSTNLARFAAAR